MSLTYDLQYAIDLARGAGKIILDSFGQVDRLTKTHAAASAEAVTDADRASQRFIVAGLKKRFPGDGVIGEENEAGDAITFDCPDPEGRVWVIDPIDGTNNFIAGYPGFAVCIGLMERGMPLLGVVLDVMHDRLYSAVQGEGAWLGTKRLEALDTPMSARSILMLTGSLADAQGRLPEYVIRWLGRSNWKPRILGSAALESIQVAAGIAHGALTLHGKLWDIAAPAAILAESGATLTDLQGQPIFPFNLRHYSGAKVPFLAAAPSAHAELLRDIQLYP